MARYIIYGIIIYLVYLGLKALLNKLQILKKHIENTSQKTSKTSYSKKDLDNIEDADFEELNKK